MKNLIGYLLIASPKLTNTYFNKSVVLVFQQDNEIVNGLIINNEIPKSVISLYEQLKIKLNPKQQLDFLGEHIKSGGPVNLDQGYILHSNHIYLSKRSLKIANNVYLSMSGNDLRYLINDIKPEKFKIIIGNCGWSQTQLNQEIANGDWLVLKATRDILYINENDIYEKSLLKLGVDKNKLLSPYVLNV